MKLQRLETQKRAALDSEDYAKAAEIKKSVEARPDIMICHDVQRLSTLILGYLWISVDVFAI